MPWTKVNPSSFNFLETLSKMVRLKERTLLEAYFNTGPNSKNSYLIDALRVETGSMNIEATDSNILNFQVM